MIDISIIVPIYMTEQKYLENCINSIKMQTIKNIEVILVNDGMTEENFVYISKVIEDERFSLIGKENHGVCYARNLGIKKAQGKYITFVDSDDYLDKLYCEKMLENAKNNNADCVICGYNRVYENKAYVMNCNTDFFELNSEEYLEKILNVENGLGFSHMKLIRSKVLRRSGILFDETLQLAEDAVFCAKLSGYFNTITKINEPLYNYMFNSNSVVRKYDPEYANKFLKSMKAMKEYLDIEYLENESIKACYNNYVMYHVLLIVVNYCCNLKSGMTYVQKKVSIRNICKIPLFSEAIILSSYVDLSLSRKIMLFTLKHKWYMIASIIALVRQIQFERVGK